MPKEKNGALAGRDRAILEDNAAGWQVRRRLPAVRLDRARVAPYWAFRLLDPVAFGLKNLPR